MACSCLAIYNLLMSGACSGQRMSIGCPGSCIVTTPVQSTVTPCSQVVLSSSCYSRTCETAQLSTESFFRHKLKLGLRYQQLDTYFTTSLTFTLPWQLLQNYLSSTMPAFVDSSDHRTSTLNLLLLAIFLLLNSALSVTNRWALGLSGFSFPLLLTACHMAFSFCALLPVMLCKPFRGQHISCITKQWKGMLAIGVCMACNISLNNTSLVMITLSTNQIIRYILSPLRRRFFNRS